jgi:hypothetical protein
MRKALSRHGRPPSARYGSRSLLRRGGQQGSLRGNTFVVAPRYGLRMAGLYRIAVRRLAAWFVDWLFIAAYAAALIPAGLLLNRAVTMPVAALNVMAFFVLVAPVTVWLAWWEYAKSATPGKRLLRLRVTPRPRFGKALARNVLKVALPWEVAHTGVYLLTKSDQQAVGMVLSVGAQLVILWLVVTLFVGDGRTPYDRATSLAVVTP